MARSVWSGSISFGLVNVPVKAYTAVHDHDVHFHRLDKESGARVRNQQVSEKTGETVERGDIELGYETAKGRYVTFDPEEIEGLRPASTRSIDVSDFVPLEDIDPVFYEHTYWLAPDGDAATGAYELLLAAMVDQQRVGIGTVVMRTKQYLAAVRPFDGALAMSTMRFADEVVSRDDLDAIPTKVAEPPKKQLDLALQIIEALAGDWKPDQYHDTYTEELRDLIERKAAGEELVVEENDAGGGAEVLDLMDALRASVDQARSGSRKAKRASGTRTVGATSKTGTAKKATAKKKCLAKKKAPAKKKASTKTSAGRKKAARRSA